MPIKPQLHLPNYSLIGLTLLMFKKSLLICLWGIGLLGCQQQPAFELADNPLDGGRYFIESCLHGEFKKARFYLIDDSTNQSGFEEISKHYYTLDKEGRQQLRQASIQINNINALDSNTSVIYYQNSFDKEAKKIKVLRTEKGWKVDLRF